MAPSPCSRKQKPATHLLDSQGAVHLLEGLIWPVVEVLDMDGGQLQTGTRSMTTCMTNNIEPELEDIFDT